MKIKKLLLIICFSMSFGAYAQSEKTIYIVSDSVEVRLKKQIDKSRRNNPGISFSCMLGRGSDDLFSISLLKNQENSGDSFVKGLVKSTNRYLLIEKEKIPLIFDYDFKFGSSDVERIGHFGEREGNIKRSSLLHHEYTIFFDSQGDVRRTSEF